MTEKQHSQKKTTAFGGAIQEAGAVKEQ